MAFSRGNWSGDRRRSAILALAFGSWGAKCQNVTDLRRAWLPHVVAVLSITIQQPSILHSYSMQLLWLQRQTWYVNLPALLQDHTYSSSSLKLICSQPLTIDRNHCCTVWYEINFSVYAKPRFNAGLIQYDVIRTYSACQKNLWVASI